MTRNSLVELTLVFQTSTVSAWGVTENGEDDEEVIWLPRSQCEAEVENMEEGKAYEFQVPEWMAQQKGLI